MSFIDDELRSLCDRRIRDVSEITRPIAKPQNQKKRYLVRLDRPDKHWKFSSADIRERSFWGDYRP
jgi:Polyphosphate kinase 2 (PPK2)